MSLFETWTKDALGRTISGISGATKIGISQIADIAPGPLQTVLETIVNRIPPLDTTDTPSNGEVLTYDSSVGKYRPSTQGGTGTFSGTGAQTAFNIAHNLGTTPTVFNVTPGSSAASGAFYVTADATNLIVTYIAAPASGTNNVVLRWRAT